MKRFISALSSLCLGVTAIVPLFPQGMPIATAADSDMTFDMVVEGDGGSSFDAASGKNVYEVAPGTETFTVAWKVKNDPGTAGMQMNFDFGGMECTKRKAGDAYEVAVQWNKTKYSYVFGQDQELKAADGSVISYFTFNVPSEEGNYEIKLNNDKQNIVRPRLDEDPDINFNFNGLVVKVGEPKETQATKATQTTQNTQGNNDVEKPAPKSGTIQYDMIAKGKTNGFNGKNNTVTVEPGEQFTVDWTVKNDPGTAGMQIYFDFGDLTFEKRKAGDAYEVGVQWNKTSHSYVFAADEAMTAADGAVISTFTFTAPEKAGTYVITLNEGDKPNIVRPLLDEDDDIPFTFYGLAVTVDGEAPDTTKATQTTKATEQNTNVEKPEPKKGTVQYDMIAQDKKNGFNGENNTVTVAPGEQFTVDWKVKNDPGTAGMQIYFDFGDLTFNKRKAGDAYEVGVQWNKTSHSFVFAADEAMTAADGAVISSFTFTAPEKEGTYVITLNESDKPNLVRPLLDEDPDIPYSFYGLAVTVSDDEGETTKTTAGTDKPQPQKGTVYYELTADGAVAGGKNNTVTVEPGSELTVQWIVKNDPGTAGMQMTLDFDGLDVKKRKAGDAYEVSVQWNKDKLKYVWGQEEELTAKDGAVVSSFVLEIPDEDGKTYTLGINKSAENIIRPLLDEDDDIPFEFVGLVVNVTKEQTTTEAPETETTGTTTVTTTEGNKDTTTENTEVTKTEETTAPLKTEANIAAGKVNWTIATVNGKAGATVEVPVSVSDDGGTAGFQIAISHDEKLTLTKIKWGDAYTGEMTENSKDGVVVWADKEGSDQVAADDAVAFTLVFEVAEGASGTLPVKFGDMDTSNTSGNALTVTKKDGAVIIPVPAGKSNWTIGTKHALAGAEVSVPVTVTGDEGTAGFTVTFKLDEGLAGALKSITKGDAYTNGEFVINKDEVTVVWADDESNDQKGEGTVINLNFVAPEKEGTYPINFAELEVVNTTGELVTVAKKDGALIVDPNAGKSNWEIATVELENGGVEVTLPVTVTKDEGTAGYVVFFKLDEKIDAKSLKITADKGYVGETIINPDGISVVWSSDDGEDQKADGVVLNLTMMAPEAEGTYPVTFETLEVVNTAGAPLEVTKTDGAIIIGKKKTETSETTTDATETTTNTTDTTETTVTDDTTETTEPKTDESTTLGSDTTAEWVTATTTSGKDTEQTASETTTSNTETTASVSESGTGTGTETEPIKVVDGESNWKIGKGEGYVGEEIPVEVTVNGDSGTAGFVVEYSFDSDALKLKEIKWNEGYTGEPVVNTDGKIVVWAEATGDNQKADGTIMTLVFVGSKPGEYDVDFAALDVCDTEGKDVKVNKTKGLVIVKEKPETETSTTENTTETTETTTLEPSDTVTSNTTTDNSETEAPVTETTQGATDTTEPATETTNGATDTTEPATETTQGATDTTEPATETTQGASDTTEPATETTQGATDTTEPATETTQGATDTTEPATETTQGATDTTEPATETTQGATDTTEPATETTQGATDTTEPATETTQGATDTTEPATETTQGATDTTEPVSVTSTTAETETSASKSETTAPQPQIAIFDIGEVIGDAGKEVKVPVKVVLDPGTSGLTMEFKVADGFKVTGMEWGDAYPAASAVEWNADTATVVWADPEGTLTAAASGAVVLNLIVLIPEDAKENVEYPVAFNRSVLSALGANDVEHLVDKSLDGWIMVNHFEPPVDTFFVNDFDVDFTAPARKNYWSHDSRKFGNGRNGTNDGLVGMKAIATVYNYAVNKANNHFVNDKGEDLLDASGNAMVYDPNGAMPAGLTRDMAVKVQKDVDLTQSVRAKYAEVKHPTTGKTIALDTAEGIWINEVNALIAAGEGKDVATVHPKSKYEIEFYYYQDEDTQYKLGNGTDPVLMGKKDIYIGVKGDINMDGTISIEDAKMALDFHVAVHQTNLTYQLNEDPEIGKYPVDGSNEEGLAHYLGNVRYKGDEEPYLDIQDVKSILDYTVAGLTNLEQSWEKYVGYDFPDEFYPGY